MGSGFGVLRLGSRAAWIAFSLFPLDFRYDDVLDVHARGDLPLDGGSSRYSGSGIEVKSIGRGRYRHRLAASFQEGALGGRSCIPILFLAGAVLAGPGDKIATKLAGPELISLQPLGGRQGSNFSIRVRGKMLDGASAVWFPC